MYPEINKYVDLLHSKEISSFMVTNAQFPDAMKMLKPVTQLYVSIDASTKEELKKIDRPLHKDFWERYVFFFGTPFYIYCLLRLLEDYRYHIIQGQLL